MHRVSMCSLLGKLDLDRDRDKINQLSMPRNQIGTQQGQRPKRARGSALLGLQKDSDEERVET